MLFLSQFSSVKSFIVLLRIFRYAYCILLEVKKIFTTLASLVDVSIEKVSVTLQLCKLYTALIFDGSFAIFFNVP